MRTNEVPLPALPHFPPCPQLGHHLLTFIMNQPLRWPSPPCCNNSMIKSSRHIHFLALHWWRYLNGSGECKNPNHRGRGPQIDLAEISQPAAVFHGGLLVFFEKVSDGFITCYSMGDKGFALLPPPSTPYPPSEIPDVSLSVCILVYLLYDCIYVL